MKLLGYDGRPVKHSLELQSNQVKRTPQDYINELIIWNIEPAYHFKNAIVNW